MDLCSKRIFYIMAFFSSYFFSWGVVEIIFWRVDFEKLCGINLIPRDFAIFCQNIAASIN